MERSATLSSVLATAKFESAFLAFAQATRSGNPLRLPPGYAGGMLMVEPKKVELWPGKQTEVFAVNGSVPGPTIRVQKGTTFQAHVMNMLTEPLVLHWHGIIAPSNMDGHPRDAVAGGASYLVNFPVNQRAGTYWYHAHTDLLTGKQVYRGVAGAFIVEDPSESTFGLPSADRDILLMISDKRPDAAGQLPYAPTMAEVMTGFLGDSILVNGTPDAFLSVDRGVYRLRLVNASNARVYKIGLSDQKPIYLIANDAGLLPKPIELGTLMLPPGGRAEILVNFANYARGTSLKLVSHPFTPPEGGGGHGGSAMPTMSMGPMQGTELDIIRFDVDREDTGEGLVPSVLVPFSAYDPMNVKRSRSFSLGVSHLDKHQINGASFEPQRIDFTVPKDELELWEIKDTTNEFHPIHPHGAHFQVLERSSAATIPSEDTGWKDTVLVGPNETVKLLVKFETEGIFVNHCHNLEHEDDGMMQNFEVKSGAIVEPEGIRLTIERMGQMLHLSWPMSAEGYQLQSRNSLSAAAPWQPVNQMPIMTGDRMSVMIDAAGQSNFYRLTKP